MIDLFNADCLVKMNDIADRSVDMICCDLPYGVLNKGNDDSKWDTIIPLDKLWEQYRRIIKENGAIVLTAQGMFTAQLMMSNPSWWRYNLVWDKQRTTGFLNARRMPLRCHEDICVFYQSLPTYNPQMVKCLPHQRNHSTGSKETFTNRCYGEIHRIPFVVSDEKFPRSIIALENKVGRNTVHPTQKPVELMEYLIKTYTNEGDLVLDNCMGSGTCGVACKHLNRSFIGIEKEEKYFLIAKDRIEQAVQQDTINKQAKSKMELLG